MAAGKNDKLGFDGEKYRQASTHQKEWGAKLIAELKLTGDEHVLDLGSGDGALTAQLAGLVPQGLVLGVDFSPSMIEAARHHASPNLQFELLDINQLGYEEMFDAVFSNSTLHWIKDHRNLYIRVFRALKPGGILRFNFAADGNCSTFNRVVQEVMALEPYTAAFRQFEWPWYMPDPNDYRALLNKFPFQELKVWGENADRFFPDAETMIHWIDQPSLVPFLPPLVPAERGSFRGEVVRRMIIATRQSDGRCFETFRRVHIFGRKPSLGH